MVESAPVSKTQIRGPQRIGATVRDEGALTEAVVASYSALTTEEAQAQGQAAAAAILPARRALWALAERLIPKRLAAALRARLATSDGTGRDGVRELRAAIADWLDPPPCCRWCRRPIREDDEGRTCTAKRSAARLATPREAVTVGERFLDGIEPTPARRPWTPHPIVCRASKTRTAPGATIGRCGTLALYPAGYVSLEVMAAVLAAPKGAARSYDVAADRDGKALLAATCDAPPRPVGVEGDWEDEGSRRCHEAVQAVVGGGALPRPIADARARLDATRAAHVRANGRAILGVQVRYGVPGAGACRADLLQAGAMGADRAGMDYDETQARFTSYGADWIRQGIGEARASRDLVGTPEWVHQLRGKVEDRLPSTTRADLLRAIEALSEVVAAQRPNPQRRSLADALVALLLDAEVRENLPGTRPARYIRRPLFADRSDDARETLAASVIKAALGKRKVKAKTPASTTTEDPERVRERVAAWVGRRLMLDTSGAGILSALRHSAPVFVQVGSGGDDDEDAQGTDGAGGSERQAHVLEAPDEQAAADVEAEGRARWQAALSALAALQAQHGTGTTDDPHATRKGQEAAEVIRRHHGLDSIAEDRNGQTGESFASIAETGLACSGRRLTKEALRKIYTKGIVALQAIIAGNPGAAHLHEDDEDDLWSPPERPTHRSPWRPMPAPVVVPTVTSSTTPPTRHETDDGGAWASWRDQAAAVAW